LCIIDISVPDTPFEVGFFDTSGLAFDVEVTGNHAYVGDGKGGLRVIDVSVPNTPVEVGFFITPSIAFSLAVAGTYTYISDAYGGLYILAYTPFAMHLPLVMH
jgi:hypothetical protein